MVHLTQFVFWLVTCAMLTKTVFAVCLECGGTCTTREISPHIGLSALTVIRLVTVLQERSSCAVLQNDGCVLSVICNGQQIQAQSSAEAEVNAAVMGMQDMLHVQKRLACFGETMRVRVRVDSLGAGFDSMSDIGTKPLGSKVFERHLDAGTVEAVMHIKSRI